MATFRRGRDKVIDVQLPDPGGGRNYSPAGDSDAPVILVSGEVPQPLRVALVIHGREEDCGEMGAQLSEDGEHISLKAIVTGFEVDQDHDQNVALIDDRPPQGYESYRSHGRDRTHHTTAERVTTWQTWSVTEQAYRCAQCGRPIDHSGATWTPPAPSELCAWCVSGHGPGWMEYPEADWWLPRVLMRSRLTRWIVPKSHD